MQTLTKRQIKAYETNGFKRWTRGELDRLYINCTEYGCKFSHHKTGSIRSASFCGNPISNAEGYRFKATKVFVDVRTGELHITTNTSFEDEIRETVEAIIADIDAETPADDDESGYENKAQRNKREFVESADAYIEQNAKDAQRISATKGLIRLYADAQPDAT